MAIALIEGAFTATGQSAAVSIFGRFNVSLAGFGAGTLTIERSFDGGSSWRSVESFTASAEKRGLETENGVLYRVNCTAYTSGTLSYRISR